MLTETQLQVIRQRFDIANKPDSSTGDCWLSWCDMPRLFKETEQLQAELAKRDELIRDSVNEQIQNVMQPDLEN